MSGSYRQCVECGKRALKFATRCPGCGIDLPDPAPFGADEPHPAWGQAFKGMMAVLGIIAAVATLQRTPTGPLPLSAETPFVKPVVIRKPAVAAALPAVAVLPAAVAPTTSATLVAKGWTHVRKRPIASAGLEAVLTPGDTVTADSLVNGWYRVALYGDVLGYAKESSLTPVRP